MRSLFNMFWFTILIFGALCDISQGQINDCDVTLQNGRVIGSVGDTVNPNRKTCQFLGIPFATPPVGQLRFAPPQPPQSWTDTLNATQMPNWCPQAETPPPETGIKMDEDCLYLNVFQPQIENVEYANLPVMVFIHGGSFTGGSSYEYNARRLLARGDVILVVPHYRLGILGFFSTGDDVIAGNNGLKDQTLAIKWVHDNIANFGGNPGNVTLFGESAGSGSVLLQMISPLTQNQDLFHGIIAQSGSTLSAGAYDKNPAESAKQAAVIYGCPSTSSAAIASCMRSRTWQRIILGQGLSPGKGPAIEHVHQGAFLTKHPLEIMTNEEIPNVPVMLGVTKHDGSFFLAALYISLWGPLGLDRNATYMRNQIVPDLVKYYGNFEDEANRAVSSSIEMAYLSGVNRSSWEESMPGLVDIMSVFFFKSSVLHLAEVLSRRNLPVYLYSFEHHSNNTLLFDRLPVPVPVEPGVAHADDLLYLFDFPAATFSTDDTTFSEIFVDMWLNFAKYGNPTPGPDERFEPWATYTEVGQLFMKLNVTPTIKRDFTTTWRPNGFEWS